MNNKKFNRNIILASCCFINMCLGSLYTWSVFAQAEAEYLSGILGVKLTSADLSIVYTIANFISPLTMITGGRINDLLGPKIVIFIGGLMFGGGLIISGFAKSVMMLVLGFGIIGGLGLGMAYVSTISTSVKFFPDKRGLAGGITTAAYGLSSVILPPIASMIIKNFGAPFAFKAVGITFMIVISVSVLFVEKYPEEISQTKIIHDSGNDVNWQKMLRMPVFYVMMILLICGAFSGMMIISQASQVAVNMMKMNVQIAAMIVSILALFNTFGRLAAGVLSDKIGRIGTLKLSCIISAVSEILFLFAANGNMTLFYCGIAGAGISFGAFMGVYPSFTADRFGAKNNSVNYAIMFIGFALAGLFGPQIIGNIYKSSGLYDNAFTIACVLSMIGFVLTFICERMK